MTSYCRDITNKRDFYNSEVMEMTLVICIDSSSSRKKLYPDISTKEVGTTLVKHVSHMASKSNLSTSSKFTMNLILLISVFTLTVPALIEGGDTNSLKADVDGWQ